MAIAISAPQTHNQPSRKGKKAWRKNIDINPITDGLADLRDEVITTGGPIAEKASDEIFTIDSTGDDAVRKLAVRAHKPLKVDEILAKRSQVPAIDTRKRKFGDGILPETTTKRWKADWVSKKEVQRLKQVAVSGDRNVLSKATESTETIPTTDLWAASFTTELTPNNTATEDQNTYLPKARLKVPPSTLQRPPIPLTTSGRPTPSIPTPNPGTSYNPLFTDWDDLLTLEGEKEVRAERKRLQEQAAETERAARIEAAQKRPAGDLGDRNEDGESAWEGIESEAETAETQRKRPARKTPAQRNRTKRRKEAERQAKHKQKMRMRDRDQRRQAEDIVQLARAAKKATTTTTTKQSQSPAQSQPVTALTSPKDDDDDNIGRQPPPASQDEVESSSTTLPLSLRRGALPLTSLSSSHHKTRAFAPIPPPTLDLVLPSELQDSLRRLKPEGNLLSDRMRTWLVNGKVEARRRITQPKKARRKATEKWWSKDFRVSV